METRESYDLIQRNPC